MLVAGGAGFLGSQLCDFLLACGLRVICVDNLETGSANVEHNVSGAPEPLLELVWSSRADLEELQL